MQSPLLSNWCAAIPVGPTLTVRGGAGRLVGAGQQVEVECRLQGARPAPTLTWYLGRKPVLSARHAAHRTNITVTRNTDGTQNILATLSFLVTFHHLTVGNITTDQITGCSRLYFAGQNYSSKMFRNYWRFFFEK